MPSQTSPLMTRLRERILDQYPRLLWFRALILLLAFILLVFLFYPNQVKLNDKLNPKIFMTEQTQQASNGSNAFDSQLVKELIIEEHKKAVDEIKASIEQMDTWYHYKFILIGGVIAVFLGNIGIWGRQSTVTHKTSERILESILMSNRTGAMLTLICLVAFVIDMHIRTYANGIQQLGQWIATYVEPAYFKMSVALNSPPGKEFIGNIPRAAINETGFIPWETFLRFRDKPVNPLYPAVFSIQLHFMTMVAYVLYLMVFQNVSLLGKRVKKQRHQIVFIGFLLVHISVLAFTVVAHTVQDSFEVKCFPVLSGNCYLPGPQGYMGFLLIWVGLIVVNLPYLYRLLPSLNLGLRLTESEATTEAAPDNASKPPS
jgi:hypothetical protein